MNAHPEVRPRLDLGGLRGVNKNAQEKMDSNFISAQPENTFLPLREAKIK